MNLLTPDQARFSEARRMWNGLLEPRPAVIAECKSAADVVDAVRFARAKGLTISVRGGGHGVAGRACRDGSVVIDLRGMRKVAVDGERRLAVAEGGATWADFDQATAQYGLATTGGMISTTGVGGLTLGGGIGWLMRRCGLTCDNVVAAEIVTADGATRRVSAAEHPELYWALRGAGIGFGVVTSFELALHPVARVLSGMVMHPASRAREALELFRSFCADAPEDLSAVFVFMVAPPAPFVPQSLQGKPAVAIGVCWCGDEREGERVIAPLRAFGPPAVDIIAPRPYVETQSMLDATAPEHQLNYWKSAFLPALSDDMITRLVARGTALPSPLAQVHIHQLGGAVSRGAHDGSAFDARSAAFVVNIPTMWSDPGETSSMIAWTRDAHRQFADEAMRVSYLNFQDGDESAANAWTASTRERLRRLKESLDPERLFGPDPADVLR
jgi:FAD/FMN-containing dehydrogenase